MQVKYFSSTVLEFLKLDSCSHEQDHYKLQLCPQTLACRRRSKMIFTCSCFPCNLYLVIDNHKIIYRYT